MIVSLIEVYKTYRYHDAIGIDDYVHYKFFFNQVPEHYLNDFHKLLYWDLIEKQFDGDKPVKGCYRISLNGIKFVQREIGLPEYCKVYNGKVESHIIDSYIMIEDILKQHNFVYDEIMEYDFDYLKHIKNESL